MLLSTLRSRVSSAIGLSNINGSEEQGLIDGWANEAVIQFLRETKCYVKPFTLNLTVNVGDYDLDSAMLAIKELSLTPVSGQPRTLEPTGGSEITRRRQMTVVSDAPAVYALEGANLLRIDPLPQSSSDQLKGLYIPRPTSMSSGAHDSSVSTYGGIPSEFDPVLEAYAKWKAADWDDDTSSQIGQSYKSEWEQGVVRARGRINKKAGRWGPARPANRRRRYIPTRPGIDLGN